MWLTTYLSAVRAAATNRQLPFAHIVFSPIIPYVKYVAPLLFMWSTFKVLSLDSMYVRILAEQEAQAIRKQQVSSVSDR